MAIKFSQKVVEETQESLGGYLRAHRIFRDIDLDEVHAKTMLKTQFLEAIENDTLHELIDIRFARMHILNYARFIGANINKTMALYTKQYNLEEKKSIHQQKKQQTTKKVLIPRIFFRLAALLVIIAVLFVIGFHLQRKGALHRNLFEDKNTVMNGLQDTVLLNKKQPQKYSYKREDLYKKYILKGKDVPWHVFPEYVKNK